MDIEILKQKQDKINQESLNEIYNDLPDALINLTNNTTLNYCLHEIKSGTKTGQSARVLHNWISNEIIQVDGNDKGKIRRFDRLESIWLNIVVEARKFGIPLEDLKQARTELFKSNIKNFSLLKFSVLDSILRKPKMLVIFESGHVQHFSLETYAKWVTKGLFRTHLNFNLLDFILAEYPKNAFSVDFKLENAFEDTNKLKMLYFLKTGDYKFIKLFINDTDVRLIETSQMLSENKDLMKVLSDWKFMKAEIIINDEVETLIKL